MIRLRSLVGMATVSLVGFAFSCRNPISATLPTLYFRASVNGADWGADPQSLRCQYYAIDGGYYLNIDSRSKTDIYSGDGISFTLLNASRVGTYSLKDSSGGIASYYILGENSDIWYSTSLRDTGEVTIAEIDTTHRIISGTFSFRARRDTVITSPTQRDTSKTVNVTAGSFVVQYESTSIAVPSRKRTLLKKSQTIRRNQDL